MDNISVDLIRVCVRVLRYHSALKKNEVKKFSGKRMCLESILFSKGTQSQKEKKNTACSFIFRI